MELIVRKIGSGTVIDHIPPSFGLRVASLLKLEKAGDTFVVLANVPSAKMGRKDIVKLEGRELTRKEAEMISLVAQGATVNIIRDSAVAEKIGLAMPEVFDGMIRCPNGSCITNHEHVATKFRAESTQPLSMRCGHCERAFGAEELGF